MGELVVIVGPTAVGKSDVAIEVARRMDGEIVSADSVQVYRHLDIGAAKPTPAERSLVCHHMIDIVDPDREYSVADYQQDARSAIKDIHKRGRLPILVGGSGLYVRAVTENYAFSASGQSSAIRESLQKEAEKYGDMYLYRKLQKSDPLSAEKIHPRDRRRIIRALEVYEQCRRPLSLQVAETKKSNAPYKLFMFGLTMPREILYRRIETRVDMMIEHGLVAEVKGLLERGFSAGSKAMSSLGYRHMISCLQGESTLEQALETLKRDTRRFAKRQLTWFRRDEEILWLDVSNSGGKDAAAENICKLLAGYYQSKENT